MKQMGILSKEEKPAAGKLINQTTVELEAAMTDRRAELEIAAALPKEPTDFTLPGEIPVSLPSTIVSQRPGFS